MPFYNTAPPTSSSKNNITDIAVTYGIRDFLLNKNLLPVYPMALNQSPGTVRIGEPVLDTMVGMGNVGIPFGLPLETNGILRMEIAVLPNQFKNTDSTANDLQNIDYLPKLSNPDYPNTNYPQGIQSYPTKPTITVEQYGIQAKTVEAGWRKKANLLNLYLDVDGQVDAGAWFDQKPLPISQQVKGYLDTYGGLNLGGSPAIQASSVIGSVLNGQGLGLAKGGVVTNYDVRSSLAGRVLGAAGLINDTKLGMIGGQQLALALANNAAFNIQQQAFGALNAQDNVLSLVKNGTLAGFRPNYQITVPAGNGGKVLDYTAKILGFTLPKSYLQDAGSIFQDENGNIENITRANNMILNTGKGQVVALLTNVRASLAVNSTATPFRSGYAPAYANNKGQAEITDGILYAFNNGEGHLINPLAISDGVIPDMNYMREGKVESSGFLSTEGFGGRQPQDYTHNNIKNPGFTWTSSNGKALNNNNEYDEYIGDKKSLLSKTQALFNSKGMRNIVSAKGDMGVKPSQINTANGGGISHGSAVLTKGNYDEDGHYVSISAATADETYCRSWTTFSRYEKVNNLIRSKGLDSNVPYRLQTMNSTLDQYGFPKVAPYVTDKYSPAGGKPTNYMFSIENLAWSENFRDLLPVEIGPGDLLTGKRGRIMWFPPYNIQFSENAAVSWESNNFIGRGEPVYTYNNTERSGQLSFSVVVDHSSYTNSFRGNKGPDDNYIASFFAGCVEPSKKFADKLTVTEMSELSTKNLTIPQIANLTPEVAPDNFHFYYPNDYSDVVGTLGPLGSGQVYENGLSGTTKIDYSVYTIGASIGTFAGGGTTDSPWNDYHNYGLNGWRNEVEVDGVKFSGVTDPAYMPALKTYLETKCPHCIIKITSYASPQGVATSNDELAKKRSDSMKKYLIANLYPGKPETYTNPRIPTPVYHPLTTSESKCVVLPPNVKPSAPVDTFECKVDRRTFVEFEYSAKLHGDETVKPAPVVKKQEQRINTKITNRFYNEATYFEQLTDEDYFVFDRFRDKIKYFHPAFHSTTPEGLNSRLTFLHQCTRQGPTLEEQEANNLAFGRPPVCILRIGDFYNTKIIIDSIGIDYEPLVWDLNPEGVGVQPMIANVNLSFKFVGGSSLMGPINKLQNALSFNYYANAHVYDIRADYIAKTEEKKFNKEGFGNDSDEDGTTGLKPYKLQNDFTGSMAPEITRTETDIASNTPVVDQTALNEQVNSGDGNAKQASGDTGPFTIDNIGIDSNTWNVAENSKEISFAITLKKNGSNVVKPTSNYQVDVSLIHAMQPKNTWSTDSLLTVCSSDLEDKTSIANPQLINSVLITPDGIKNGGVTSPLEGRNLTQIKGGDQVGSKTAVLNIINQMIGLNACAGKTTLTPKTYTVNSVGKGDSESNAISAAETVANKNICEKINQNSCQVYKKDGGSRVITQKDGKYVCTITGYIGETTPSSSSVTDYGFRLVIEIKDTTTGGAPKKITLTKPILITN
jgi:hypothetical protein